MAGQCVEVRSLKAGWEHRALLSLMNHSIINHSIINHAIINHRQSLIIVNHYQLNQFVQIELNGSIRQFIHQPVKRLISQSINFSMT